MVWIVGLIGAMAYTWVFDGSFNTIENDTPIRHAAMALAGLIALVMSTRRHPTLGIALSLGALAAAIVTGSRMASAVIFGIVAVNLITTRRRGPLLLVLGSVLAAVTICFIPSLTEPASEFVADVVDRGLDGSSRPDVWASVLDSCGISLFGSGAGTANTVAGSAHNGFPDPHNEFIRFACDTGLVGSILLWSFLGVAIWHTVKLLRARPNNQIALSALLALASVLLFSVVWNPITAAEFMVPVMVLVALSDGTAERVRRSDHQTSPNSYSAEV
jgi:O-antigen ligase